MKNKLPDLNNHLFEQLERLNDESLTPLQSRHEYQRAKAMVEVADQIIKGAALQLKAAQAFADIDGQKIEERFNMIDKPKYVGLVTLEDNPPSETPAASVKSRPRKTYKPRAHSS